MKPDTVMIFAAGRGTRMGPLTATRPKPLVPVAGRALIDHALLLADGAGLANRVVNTHYLGDQVQSHLAGRGVRFSPEDVLLETGGGLRHALPLLGSDPVFTLNSDAVWAGPNPLLTLAEAWDPDRMEALLLLLDPASALGHKGAGDFRLADDGRLSRGPGLVFSGAQILRTDRLANVPEQAFSLNLIWDQMAEAKGLFGIVYDGAWCDVGSPGSIPLAEALLADVR